MRSSALADVSIVVRHVPVGLVAPCTGAGLSALERLKTVTVTAQKREQNAQDVPISMAIVSSETLAKANVFSLGDLQKIVPNMQVSDNAANPHALRARCGRRRSHCRLRSAQTVSIWDGVYIGEPMETDAILTDLERVEVLRGPQGYLLWREHRFPVRSTSSPTSRTTALKAKLSFPTGNKNAFRLDGMVNVPLVDDKILLRVSAGYQRRDGVHSQT